MQVLLCQRGDFADHALARGVRLAPQEDVKTEELLYGALGLPTAPHSLMELIFTRVATTLADGGTMQDAFELFNPSCTGAITRQDFRQVLTELGARVADSELEVVMQIFDGGMGCDERRFSFVYYNRRELQNPSVPWSKSETEGIELVRLSAPATPASHRADALCRQLALSNQQPSKSKAIAIPAAAPAFTAPRQTCDVLRRRETKQQLLSLAKEANSTHDTAKLTTESRIKTMDKRDVRLLRRSAGKMRNEYEQAKESIEKSDECKQIKIREAWGNSISGMQGVKEHTLDVINVKDTQQEIVESGSISQLLMLRRDTERQIAYMQGDEWDSPRKDSDSGDSDFEDPETALQKALEEAVQSQKKKAKAEVHRKREMARAIWKGAQTTPVPTTKVLDAPDGSRIAWRRSVAQTPKLQPQKKRVGRTTNLTPAKAEAKIENWKNHCASVFEAHAKGQQAVKQHKVRMKQEAYDRFMHSRLKAMASQCDESIKQLYRMDKELYRKTKGVNLRHCSLFACSKPSDSQVQNSEEIEAHLKRSVRRCQFQLDELKKMYINCRKHSVAPPDVVLDPAQFAKIVGHYGYKEPKLVSRLFELFDDDNSGEIDFDEMIKGLAKLAPEKLLEAADTFFDVIDVDGNDEVSRLELVKVFFLLERTSPKECFADVETAFKLMNLTNNACMDREAFKAGLEDDTLRQLFAKYLAVEGGADLRFTNYALAGVSKHSPG